MRVRVRVRVRDEDEVGEEEDGNGGRKTEDLDEVTERGFGTKTGHFFLSKMQDDLLLTGKNGT